MNGLDRRLGILVDGLDRRTGALEAASGELRGRLDVEGRRGSAVAAALDRISRPAAAAAGGGADAPSAATAALMEGFYVLLEARFRGDVSDIGQRQLVYLPDIEGACAGADTPAVLDLGCGRGEWLGLLSGGSIQAIGVDTNEGQLAQARDRGLAVVNQDGLQFLRAQPEGRFAAVTAFHLFEHLPFPVLAEWLVEIIRVLRPGGILIAETPDPQNLVVGANTFHLDPTHQRPLPSGVLATLAESVGLQVRAIRPLHPHAGLADALQRLPENVAYLLFGYQDYGIIAERPARAA